MGLGSRPQGRYKYQQESIPPGRATCEKPERYAARGKDDAGSGTEASVCMRLSRLGATWRGMRRAHGASREGDLHRTWSDRIDEQKAGKTKDSQVSSFKLTRNRII